MIVLGIDPGTVAAGYGAVRAEGGRTRLVTCGAVRARRSQKLAERLRAIHDGLAAVVAETRPDVAVVEQPFAGENLATAIAIGEARGVALLACAAAGVPVEEYSPAEIKRAVVGSGAARKDQVALMVKAVLGLAEPPTPSDAADALAAAICYLHRAPVRTAANKAGFTAEAQRRRAATLADNDPREGRSPRLGASAVKKPGSGDLWKSSSTGTT